MATMQSLQQATKTPDRAGNGRRNGLTRAADNGLTRATDIASPALLADVIEGEIIPRLLMAHRHEPRLLEQATGAQDSIADGEVDELTPLVLRLESAALLAHVEAILARGVTVRTLFVDLLAPTARRLGDWWDEDRCDFIDVTMGLWRLQEIVREIASRVPATRRVEGRSALFSAMPGEQHSFGTVMVEELFRRSGWATASVADGDCAELLETVADRPFDLIGLTVMCDTQVPALPTLIGSIRRASRNPRIVVMVGGRALNDDPEIAIRVGADGTAPNGGQAVSKAELLVSLAARQVMARA